MPGQQLNLMIVVNQMLTGYDSKWLGALFLDKCLDYENIIQAFSRTNRNLDASKTCGVIRYYRRVHTMDRDIQDAIRLYSDGFPVGLIVKSICENVQIINNSLDSIIQVFKAAGIGDLSRLPDSHDARAMFCKQFNILGRALRAAKVQGFTFDQVHYECVDFLTGELLMADCKLTEEIYDTLMTRYNELPRSEGGMRGDRRCRLISTPRLQRSIQRGSTGITWTSSSKISSHPSMREKAKIKSTPLSMIYTAPTLTSPRPTSQ